MKRFNRITTLCLAFILFISCQSKDWYVGEWTDGESTFILTKDKYINEQLETNSSISIIKEKNGGLKIYVDDFANEGGGQDSFYYADPKNKQRLLLVGEPEEGDVEILSEFHKKNASDNGYSGKVTDERESDTTNNLGIEEESLDEGYGDPPDDDYGDYEDVIGDYDEVSMGKNEADTPIEEMGFDMEDISKNLIIVIEKDVFKELPSDRVVYFKEDCGVSVEQWNKRGFLPFKPLKMEEREESVVLHYSWVTKPQFTWEQTDINDFMKKASKVSLPEGLESGYVTSARNSSYLRCVTLPNSVTYIPSSAFSGCSNLLSVSLPSSLEYIGDEAFYGCTGLNSIKLPESLLKIGSMAFSKCGLYSLEIPSSLTEIGKDAFRDCVFLREIIFPSSSNLKSVGGFEGCAIVQVSLPNSVQEIEARAFSKCTNLQRVTLPDIRIIGDDSFAQCHNLTEINIPESVTVIGANAFAECSRLQSITIPDGVEHIHDGTFQKCVNLRTITVPNSVTSIGISSFEGCSSLTTLELPNTIAQIGNRAFTGSGLTHFVIPESVMHVIVRQGNAITKLRRGEVPIGLGLFAYCRNLKSVTIPEGITHIFDSAFEGCTSLSSINLPNSIEMIYKNAFNGSGLTEIVIPESVRSIDFGAFQNCPSLKRVVLSERLRNQMREYGNKLFPYGVEYSYY